MVRRHQFPNENGIYSVRLMVVNSIDVFTRIAYRDIIVDCLQTHQKDKGLNLYAWSVMTDKLHLVYQSAVGKPGLLLWDIKGHTTRQLVTAIRNNVNDARREWMLNSFESAADSSDETGFKLWHDNNDIVELNGERDFKQKVDFIHLSPVRAGLTIHPEDYPYSSARNFHGDEGLLEVMKPS